MKKLMIVAAAVCAASAARAEGAIWSVINAGAYNGYQIYSLVVCENVAEASEFESTALDGFNAMYMIESSAWETTGAKSWSEHYKAVSEMLGVLPTIAGGEAIGKMSELDQLRTVSFLLCKDGVTAGGEYVLTEALYDERLFSHEVNEFDFTDMEPLQSGTFMVDNAPEPTSALLMLLGVAGLALKRKRA